MFDNPKDNHLFLPIAIPLNDHSLQHWNIHIHPMDNHLFLPIDRSHSDPDRVSTGTGTMKLLPSEWIISIRKVRSERRSNNNNIFLPSIHEYKTNIFDQLYTHYLFNLLLNIIIIYHLYTMMFMKQQEHHVVRMLSRRQQHYRLFNIVAVTTTTTGNPSINTTYSRYNKIHNKHSSQNSFQFDRCYSTTTTLYRCTEKLTRFGIGLGQWNTEMDVSEDTSHSIGNTTTTTTSTSSITNDPSTQYMYEQIIQSSLFQNNSICNHIEISYQQPNQDLSFIKAYRNIVQKQLNQPQLGEIDSYNTSNDYYTPPKIHILWRIGYREIPATVVPVKNNTTSTASSSNNTSNADYSNNNNNTTVDNQTIPDDKEAPDTSLSFLTNDPIYQQKKQQQQKQQQLLYKKHIDDVILPTENIKQQHISTALLQPLQVIHNISSDYIQHVLINKQLHTPYNNNNNQRNTNTNNNTHDTPAIEYDDLPPLLQLRHDYPDSIKVTIMIHNPEVQYSRYYIGQQNHHPMMISLKSKDDFIETILYNTFTTLQQLCSTPYNIIDGYGVISNGLSLYEHHPSHVSYKAIFKAAKRVYDESLANHQREKQDSTFESKFYAIQLPANALETNGITVAREIQQIKYTSYYLSNLHVIGIRPLTCYSDGGTGSNNKNLNIHINPTGKNNDEIISSLMQQSSIFPFTLIDYPIEQKVNRKMITTYTNEMTQPPVAYNASYQRAIQLFDGHEILEKQAERRFAAKKMKEQQQETNPKLMYMNELLNYDDGNDYLNNEERETLHGCTILQQMIQDCHEILHTVRSIKIHELILSYYVLPILQNQFHSFDEQTSITLESYFTVYNPTMQYYVAHNTRQLLLYGEKPITTSSTKVETNLDKTTTTTTSEKTMESMESTTQNTNTTTITSSTMEQESLDSNDQYNNINRDDKNDNLYVLPPLLQKPPTYLHILPQSKRLQEFGIELLLNEKLVIDTSTTNDQNHQYNTPPKNINDPGNDNPPNHNKSDLIVNVFDAIMVGIANVDEVQDTLQIVKNNVTTYKN
jgi:hypothetical protein